jgi:hypothetical protein
MAVIIQKTRNTFKKKYILTITSPMQAVLTANKKYQQSRRGKKKSISTLLSFFFIVPTHALHYTKKD